MLTFAEDSVPVPLLITSVSEPTVSTIAVISEVFIVVLPSYREGIPLSLLEAASFEKPIITTDTPGCKEIVKNKVNGILVPPKDSSAVESAMKYLLNNRDIWDKMGREGRQLVLDKFDEKLIVKETVDLYNKI